MAEATMVPHHDDHPCYARLTIKGYCVECRLYPDTQSVANWPYCPDCNAQLTRMKCPSCHKTFNGPS